MKALWKSDFSNPVLGGKDTDKLNYDAYFNNKKKEFNLNCIKHLE